MKCAAKLGGTSIAGATVYVPTQEFYVYWHTDSSQDSFYGFKIDSVTQGSGTKTGSAEALPGYTATTLSAETYPESSHGNYGNNVNQLWKCTGPVVGTNTSFWQRIETATKSEVSSLIEQSADSIRLQAKKIMWQSNYSSMTESGELTCAGATIQGDLTTKQPWNNSYKITELKEGVIKGYKGDTQTGLLDMSAYYSDNLRHVALNGFDYLHLQAGTDILVEQTVTVANGCKLRANSIDSIVSGDGIQIPADLYIGEPGVARELYVTGTIEATGTITSPWATKNYAFNTSANLYITSDGVIKRAMSGSSKRYKNHIADLEETDVKGLYGLPAVLFKYKEELLSDESEDYNRVVPGFYAEAMDKYYPDACRYNELGQPEDWDPKKLLPAVVKLVQLQKEDIDTVKKYCAEHGHGILNEDGKCIILLNAIENQYYITLTKYGEGDLYISKKDTSSFVVTGTPDLEFDWQVTAA